MAVLRARTPDNFQFIYGDNSVLNNLGYPNMNSSEQVSYTLLNLPLTNIQGNTIGLASHNLHVNDTVRLASGLLVTVVQVNDSDHVTLSSGTFGDIIYSNICRIISPQSWSGNG